MFAARCVLRWYPNGSATIRRSAVALLLRARTPWVGYEAAWDAALTMPTAFGIAVRRGRRLQSGAAVPAIVSSQRDRELRLPQASIGICRRCRGARCAADVAAGEHGRGRRQFDRAQLPPEVLCRSWCGCGRGEPSPGADVAGASPAVSPVPVQMWQGGAQSRCRCGRVGPRERACNPRRTAQDVGRACAALCARISVACRRRCIVERRNGCA